MKRIAILTVIIFWAQMSCRSQESQVTQENATIADELTGFQDQDADYENIYENLMQIIANPVDLNKATADDLRMFYFLTEKQIQSFLEYRKVNGKLISIYELQSIPEFDLNTIERLMPLIKIPDPASELNTSLLKRMFRDNNSYLITRYERILETKEGFSSQEDSTRAFRGSPDRFYLRFRSNKPGDFSIGFTAEKDAGEVIQWNPSRRYYGTDFFSYHVQVLNKGRLKNFIIGDYQCQFGQGLILGGAFGLGKGAETITTVRKANVGLLPYSSINESGFYRGAAGTLEISKKIFLTSFFSTIKRDASTNDDGTSISSFQFSGLHRNEGEWNTRKSIREQNSGLVLNYRSDKIDAGLIVNRIHFSEPVQKISNTYNQFTFQGNENINASIFASYRTANLNFFSEAAKSFEGGVGLIAGLLASVHKNLDLSLVFRKYEQNFYSFYPNAFSENSQPQNESGFYWGWKYSWNRKITLLGFTDLFKFPWLGYRRYAPSTGYEWLVRLNYQPSKKIFAFIQFREESKDRNSGSDGNLYLVDQTMKRNYWIGVNYTISDHLTAKTRVQYSSFSTQHTLSEGLVMIQDLSLNVGKFQFTARHAIFDSDDYDTRQYVYENDVWMAFSMPAYFGVGIRNYLMMEYKVSKKLSFWVRYARTRYTDREEIGSGLDRIAGNIRNDIKFQTLFRF